MKHNYEGKRHKLVNKTKKRTQPKKRAFFIKETFPLFGILFSWVKKLFNFIFSLFKKKPQLLTILFTALICSIIIFIGINKVQSYSETLLPTSIDIEINNPQIYNMVNDDISKALFHAQKIHEKRSRFLNRINNILSSYDQIDQYWIRLGLDRKLEINATLQIPILILETKSGDKYVISSMSKIIAKNPDNSQYPGLYALLAPEIKINWKPKFTQQKYKDSLSGNNFKIFSTNKESVNFPWLINQTRIIYSNYQELGLNFLLNKVIWNSTIGFQLILAEAKNNQLPTTTGSFGNTITVLLGKENIVPRIKELKTILDNLSKKNLLPTEIDLDYTDKASFKVSDSNTSMLPLKSSSL